MKKIIITFAAIMCFVTLLFISCSTPVGLTSWKNPQGNAQISKLIVMALFDKLTYTDPFERQLVSYFSSQNLKSIPSLDFMAPFQKYEAVDLQKKFDSLGADALVIFSVKGKDVSINTSGGYYGGYRGYWGGGGQVWTTTTLSLRANLYTVKNDALIWTGDLTVTDPNDINSVSQQIAKTVFADWLKNNLLKNPPPATK